MIAQLVESATANWAKGVVANLAREPQGGDTDQLRGIVSGECNIAIANTYYFARAVRQPVRGLSDGIKKVGWVFPNQNEFGAHMNISAAGVAANAPNKATAVTFLEYLSSDQAQKCFSARNDAFPAVPGIGLSPSVASLGIFRPDTIDFIAIASHAAAAQKILSDAAWK